MTPSVAVISSTIAPGSMEHYGGHHLRFDPETRLEQTRASIASLLALGVEEIYLADNSGPRWRNGMEQALRPAQVRVYDQHQFRNKGISELNLLLADLPRLPAGRPIIKLSGRYRLKRRLDLEFNGADLVVRESNGWRFAYSFMDTVAYAVRDLAVYERFLRMTRRDIFGFPARIAGPGSLVRIVRNSLFPKRDLYPYDDPEGSIEHAAWRAVRYCGYRTRGLGSLGIEGVTGQGGDAVNR